MFTKMMHLLYSCLFILSHLISGKFALYCRVCNASDVNCKNNPTSFESCKKPSKGCFTHYQSDEEMERGCVTPNNPTWQQCVKNNMDNCFHCRYHFCNSLPIRVNRTLLCHQSKKGLEEKVEVWQIAPCTGERPVGTPDYCYTKIGRDRKFRYNALDRGCGPYEGVVGRDEFLFYCAGDGCNSHGEPNGMYCTDGLDSLTEPDDIYKFYFCRNSVGSHYLPVLCMRYEKGSLFEEGCLNQLQDIEYLKSCAFWDPKASSSRARLCQTCGSASCNKAWTKLDYQMMHRCRNEQNQIETCSMMPGLCYMHLRNGAPVKAGCVEPTTPVEILEQQNTHICNITHHSYAGCFDMGRNYSDLISCYQCGETKFGLHGFCHTTEQLTMEHKTACPIGTKYCVYAVKNNQVFRGCYVEGGDAYQFCHANYVECLYCNTNYCNGLPLQENRAKCYDTQIPGTDIQSTTLRLKRCRNLLPMFTERPCFIARKPNSLVIRAGCVEDLNVLDTGYRVSLSGGTEIIFEETILCYKCRSSIWGNCPVVRELEAHRCMGHALSAFRGCYTLYDSERQRVERGCVSEMDTYQLRFCFSPGYEELCILCANSYCNVQTV